MEKQKRYDKLFMDSAKLSANMSYCDRLKVGAVIVKDNRIIVNAWNGTLPGICNECEETIGDRIVTSEFVLHAEQNAILFAAKNGISIKGASMYITHSPCKTCAKLIAGAGIKEVIYNEEYRDTEGIDFLKKVGVKVRKKEEK
jgi:dCMP deaminase